MSLETLTLEHVPTTHTAHVAFFKDVSNVEFLQSQLLARNSDFEYAFINASCVVSRLHILAATYKALSVLLGGKLRSPNVHSEIVSGLSASNNIAESYRRYGVTLETKDLIVIKILFPSEEIPNPPSADDVWTHLSQNVKGRLVVFTDEEIAKSTDWPRVRKYYKLNGVASLNGLQTEAEKNKEMELLILGGMALRGV